MAGAVGVGGAAGTAGVLGAAVADEVPAYHVFTPWWPEQAPRFDAAVEYVPSLQTPVVPDGAPAGAWALAGTNATAKNIVRPKSQRTFMEASLGR